VAPKEKIPQKHNHVTVTKESKTKTLKSTLKCLPLTRKNRGGETEIESKRDRE
jgi:hypothetical protein